MLQLIVKGEKIPDFNARFSKFGKIKISID